MWALVATAAILLGYALQIRDGFYHPAALACVGAAVACVVAALAGVGRRIGGEGIAAACLGAGLISSLLMLAVAPIGYYLPRPLPSAHPWFLGGLGAAAVAMALIAADTRRARRAWFPALLVTFALLGGWVIRESPDPQIDVIVVQEKGIDALADARSPYRISFRNIYGNQEFYGAGAVEGRRVRFGVPYPPLSLLMAAPGEWIAGDVRYALLAALIAAAAFIGYGTGGRVAPLAAALLLFTPRTFFVLEQGWTEPFALCWLAATVFAARQAPHARGLWLGLLCAVKQHLVVALLFVRWLAAADGNREDTRRLLLRALLVAAAVTMPFVLWDPVGFWRSVVVLQFREPFRGDSLSVLSWLARTGWTPPRAVQTVASAVALAAGLLAAYRYAPRTAAGFALAIGFSFLLLFAFSKKAFCNYYFFVIGAFCTALAAGASEARDPGAAV